MLLQRFVQAAALALVASSSQAQWTAQASNTTASLRGLSVVSSRVAWASGTGGTVIRTTDGGATWRADTIPEATRFDLRAIAALDDETAVVAATAGRVWRTEDGAKTWKLVYENADSAVFLDAVAFWEPSPAGGRRGLVLGDPIAGHFLLLVTDDAGRTWREAPRDSRPAARPGEGAFAASGSSLVMLGGRHGWIGTGVNVGRALRTTDAGITWTAHETPLSAPSQAAGIFSLSFADSLVGIAAGGDYEKPDARERTVAITRDGGATWAAPAETPSGFRSAVAFVPGTNGRVVIAVGTNGSDRSEDGGRSWTRVDTVGYHAVRFAPDGTGWATGGRGRVARFAPIRREGDPNEK
ncbi:MAG: WD40/YVTN/BNR-like repeat-containing protein [Gemmatimonadaceae bacterium]